MAANKPLDRKEGAIRTHAKSASLFECLRGDFGGLFALSA
jgi:hypothetical protein